MAVGARAATAAVASSCEQRTGGLPRPGCFRRGRASARQSRDPGAVPDPIDGVGGRARRARHPRALQDRLGEDAGVRDPDRRAARPRRAAVARGARPRPDPRARPTGARGLRGRRRREGSSRAGGLRRDARPRAGARRGAVPRVDRDARPPGRSGHAGARPARRHQRARPGRGRPDVGHGLPAAGRPDRAPPAEGPADHVLLRDARRGRGAHRRGVHAQPRAPRGRGVRPRRRRGGGSSLHLRAAARQAREARRARDGGGRAHASCSSTRSERSTIWHGG